MKKRSVAILVYGNKDSGRNALEEDKYRDLAAAFIAADYETRSILYNDEQAEELSGVLPEFDMVLVWVNPVEQGHDRSKLDAVLIAAAKNGCRVSTHPEVILKMGTKEILYTTKDMDWGGDTAMYSDYEQFSRFFPAKLEAAKTRILKQSRGNGGNGVFKIQEEPGGCVGITHALAGSKKEIVSWNGFFEIFRPFFLNQGLLIDQAWNTHMANGMVRCYVCGTRVAGFGYQEINALYELEIEGGKVGVPPSKRYYFTEHCGIFSDLKAIMESTWIPELQSRLAISVDTMPVIWDADFFINKVNSGSATGKYTLCEINVSCVSPFPPSAIPYIIAEVGKRIGMAYN